MNNACPECGAVYAVAEKDIGRRIACKKCNSALIVADEGLVRDEGAAPPRKEDTAERARRDDEDRPRKRDDEDRPGRRKRNRDVDPEDEEAEEAKPRKPRGPGMGAYLGKLKGVADVPTWLYGIGLFFTVYGFFGTAIDHAKTTGRQGSYDAAKLDFEVEKRGIVDKPDGKSPTPDETKKLEERQKEWDKKREPSYRDDVAYASASEKQAMWWNVMFKMIGFFLLAFGAIGFLKPDESPLKRILGGATILLILLQVIGGGVGVAVRAGGGPG